MTVYEIRTQNQFLAQFIAGQATNEPSLTEQSDGTWVVMGDFPWSAEQIAELEATDGVISVQEPQSSGDPTSPVILLGALGLAYWYTQRSG